MADPCRLLQAQRRHDANAGGVVHVVLQLRLDRRELLGRPAVPMKSARRRATSS
jgi:hypothetical protein